MVDEASGMWMMQMKYLRINMLTNNTEIFKLITFSPPHPPIARDFEKPFSTPWSYGGKFSFQSRLRILFLLMLLERSERRFWWEDENFFHGCLWRVCILRAQGDRGAWTVCHSTKLGSERVTRWSLWTYLSYADLLIRWKYVCQHWLEAQWEEGMKNQQTFSI